MAGHSRSKNGVASLAYFPAIHLLLRSMKEGVDARPKAGHCGGKIGVNHRTSETWTQSERCTVSTR
jgi:hypothetical protein